MAWLLVIVAGVLETGFAVALKYSDGFSKTLPTIAFVVAAAGSFGLLNVALKDLPVGSAYAVWTGIGAAGTAIVGMLFLGEAVQAVKIAAVAMIVAAVAALSLAGSH